MENLEPVRVTYTSYIDIRNNMLVLVSRRITEGFYDIPEVVDKVVGSIIDIIA